MHYDLKEIAKNEVTFLYYRKGVLYYKTDVYGIQFGVPVEDIGDATFNVKEKGIMMLRWIKAAIKERDAELAQIGAAHG